MAATVTVEMLPPNAILVDYQYQRPVQRDWVNKIIRTFDTMALEPPMISKREDGTYWVVDGQHRLAALIEMRRGETPIPMLVWTGLSVGEEADKFFMQSRSRSIHPVQLYKARLFAGEPTAMQIEKVVAKHGFHIRTEKKGDAIQAPGMLDTILAGHGPDRLDLVLGMCSAIWRDDRTSLPSHLIGGINAVLTRYPTIDQDRLVRVLRSEPYDTLTEQAKAMRKFMTDRVYVLYGRAMVNLYNKGLRTKLPDWDTTLEAVNLESLVKAKQASAEAAHVRRQANVS